MNRAPNAGALGNGYQNGLDTEKDNLFSCAPQPWTRLDAVVGVLPPSFPVRITAGDDGRFRLDGDRDAIAIPVRDRANLISGLVAYFPDRPGVWFLKEGTEPILGIRQIAGATIGAGALPLYPTPASWVEAEGAGACILDWTVGLLPIFQDVPEIDLSHLSLSTAEALRARLRLNFAMTLPRITGVRGERHAA